MGKIQVAVRSRPLSAEHARNSPWRICGNVISMAEESFRCDRIFGEECKTFEVYESIREIVAATVGGFDGTVFAYGQTNSGKTHTMQGSAIEPGVIPLAVDDIFQIIQEDICHDFLLRISYMEVYNEEINDLLAPQHRKLEIHQNTERGIFVAGLKEEIVTSLEQVLQLMKSGESHRHIGETSMNSCSSRSHTIFRMIIECRDKSQGEDSGISRDAFRSSCLNLVDLAGSERAAKTGAEGVRLKEGAYINKSLMTLGTVIKKLSKGAESQGHIPYRNSKLTRILQNDLGGRANIAVICNITLARIHSDETKTTLKFASKELHATNIAHVNKERRDIWCPDKFSRETLREEGTFDSMRLLMEVHEIISEVQALRNLVESVTSVIDELFESSSAILNLFVDHKSYTSVLLKDIISNHETLHSSMSSKITELENEKLLLCNQIVDLDNQMRELNLEVQISAKALTELLEAHEIEKSDLFSQIQTLEEEKGKTRKDLEETRKDLEETRTRLRDVISNHETLQSLMSAKIIELENELLLHVDLDNQIQELHLDVQNFAKALTEHSEAREREKAEFISQIQTLEEENKALRKDLENAEKTKFEAIREERDSVIDRSSNVFEQAMQEECDMLDVLDLGKDLENAEKTKFEAIREERDSVIDRSSNVFEQAMQEECDMLDVLDLEMETAIDSLEEGSTTVQGTEENPSIRIKRIPWTLEEENALKEMTKGFVSKNKTTIQWKKLRESEKGKLVFHMSRTAEHLKDKWRRMTKPQEQ